METVIVEITEERIDVNKEIKEYNLVLNINLIPLWDAIQEEAHTYEGAIYLYIQTNYIIPIIGGNTETIADSGKWTTRGGVTETVKLDEISENRQVTVNAAYTGTYDSKRSNEIVTSSKIWLCEMKEDRGTEAKYGSRY